MARHVLLLVDYGSNNSIHIGLFKEELKKTAGYPAFSRECSRRSSRFRMPR